MGGIGINGFGRIGRMCLRACIEQGLEVNHINDPYIAADYMVYLFKYDSTHGQFPDPICCEDNLLVIGDRRISTSQEKDPTKIGWDDVGVEYVIEATGVFTTLNKASLHVDGGAKRVVITAPSVDAPMYVFGVNHTCYDPTVVNVVSTASCTTNCAAPIVKIMNDNFEIIEAMITSIHAITASQRTLDGPTGKWSIEGDGVVHSWVAMNGPNSKNRKSVINIPRLWRDGRSCCQNIIPTSTGAAKSLAKIIPELKDKISAIAFRVPVANVSLCDITFRIAKPTSYDEVKRAMKKASEGELKDILGYTEDDCVSSDFNHTRYSCTFDAKAGIPQTSTFMKVVAWYDNEYGYAHRVVDMVTFMQGKRRGMDDSEQQS